jgi:D-aminopeptidase
MTSYDFKAGIGTASRMVEVDHQHYTIGVLVQANHGTRHLLQVNGIPVGRELSLDRIPPPYQRDDLSSEAPLPNVESSSILVIIATDAPLLPVQCKRLARRATAGMARTGGVGYNTSGDLFLAFSTGNHYPRSSAHALGLHMLHQGLMDPLIEATAEAVEEAILNAITAAYTMRGYKGRTAYALPLDELSRLAQIYNRSAG